MEQLTRSLLFIERAPILLSLKKALRKQNFFVFECQTMEQGLNILGQVRFDFILVDLLIPGSLSSYDFCKKLKENPDTSAIPLYLFCNHPLPQEIARDYFFELKADRLLLPPFDPAQVYQQICLTFQSGRETPF